MGAGPTSRLLVLLLAGILPALALAVAIESLAAMVPFGKGVLRLTILAVVVLWAAILAVIGATPASRETSTLLAATEQTHPGDTDDASLGRLAELVRRREEQLQRLASEAAAAPVTAGPSAVAAHIVGMARRVTDDRTWVLAVLGDSPEPRPGVYEEDHTVPAPISELHRWAAVTATGAGSRPEIAVGPWGAFLVLHLRAGEGNRAQLLAPWEGRPEPSGADTRLLSLLAQHAGATLDHAKLYATVTAQAQELERLSSVQRDFLRGVTHDLQSPLASIGATASDLREQLQGQSADAELQVIAEQTRRLQRMVTQLLTMSGLEAGVVRPSAEVFRAGPVVERVIRSIRRAEGEINYRPSGPDRLAVGDPDRLEQVLWAVLDNAIKYSPPNAPILIETALVEAPDGPHEQISVSDRGLGMDAETTSRAFQQFFRADAARRVAPNGSGIGLFTANGLMDLMGGFIKVESALGAGTTVRLRLPAEVVELPGPGPA